MITAEASRPPLRILHVGSGFRPWRWGGLVAYVEDLIGEQVRRGDQPSYFFSGRIYPFRRTPRLKRWRHRGVPMLEVINSPLYDHGRQPKLELEEPETEQIFESVLAEVQPDAVHFHEIAGLPSSVLDIARGTGAPVLFTLQDYFPLCPAFKLVDADGRVCLRRRVGEDCLATTAADPREPTLLVEASIHHALARLPVVKHLPDAQRGSFLRHASGLITRTLERSPGTSAGSRTPEAFQRRREVNVERLNRVDRLIAMSSRVSELYALLGVDPNRIHTTQLTLAHIEHLHPRVMTEVAEPITFATLGGGESVEKGARVILDAMRLLSAEAQARQFRVLLFGKVAPEIEAEALGTPGIERRARFSPSDLDSVLDEVDVGLMPSIWEEAYGYAGMEFLAKGIPVIANAIGGIVDYVREDETGWLNHGCHAPGLAAIMRTVIERPQLIADLNAKLRAERESIVMSQSRHASEMDAIYRELLARRR